MSQESSGKRLLPENAYRTLKPGEEYEPIVPANSPMAEVTPWSIIFGLGMVVLFSAACVYVALRAGSGIEAAIPIAVAAIFFGKMKKVRSTMLENVIVQSIGQASGVVAAGAAFTIPALYINQVSPEWWQIFLACFLGGSLGIVLIIPLRKYFVKERHGELPFPEATATTEILVSGESSGKGAGKILLASFGLGAAYDFLVEAVHLWNPAMTTRTLFRGAGEWLYNFRIELKMHGIAMLFGLGYIIGLKYAAIIMAGSVLAYMVMVPLTYLFLEPLGTMEFLGKTMEVSAMSASDIFAIFIRPIGIGAIATAGVLGLIRMGKIILGSLSLGFKGLMKKGGVEQNEPRTQQDMKPALVLMIQGGVTLLLGALFFIVCVQNGYTVGQAGAYAGVGMVIAFLLCFLFTPVAAEAIAIVGTNPVSGMTLVTVVLASLVMAGIGLFGAAGTFVVLIVGCAVCTALSTSGALISDFKIGYWTGATPKAQQRWKFLGVAVASLVVAFVIPLMDQSYHFLVENDAGILVSNQNVLPAPQANMIAEVVKGLMSGGQQPYLLYGLGALIAILVTMAGVPTLAFALGMYLPIQINMTVLLGGFAAWLVARSGKTPKESKARANQGTLIASGMMAGAAIFGIITAMLRLDWIGYPIRFLAVGADMTVKDVGGGLTQLKSTPAPWYEGFTGQFISLVMFLGLIAATYFLARWGARMESDEEDKQS